MEHSMDLDIRLPMGWFFALLGALLVIFGLAGNRAIYERSLGINVNLIWGLVLVVFGVAMVALALRATAAAKPKGGDLAE
jgi:hypothetical protein